MGTGRKAQRPDLMRSGQTHSCDFSSQRPPCEAACCTLPSHAPAHAPNASSSQPPGCTAPAAAQRRAHARCWQQRQCRNESRMRRQPRLPDNRWRPPVESRGRNARFIWEQCVCYGGWKDRQETHQRCAGGGGGVGDRALGAAPSRMRHTGCELADCSHEAGWSRHLSHRLSRRRLCSAELQQCSTSLPARSGSSQG